MKILLDNCVDVRAKGLFVGCDVAHVIAMGWAELSNGKLLRAAADAGFGVVVTVDKNIRYQQNLALTPVSILELDVARNRMQELEALRVHLDDAIAKCAMFRYVSVRADGVRETLFAI